MWNKTKLFIALSFWACVDNALADVLPECANCGCCVKSECFEGGYCIRGCREGYWGNNCQNLCPKYCTSCGRNAGKLYGTKIHQCYKCVKGRFPGPTMDGCSNKCPTNCAACYSANVCTECAPGFYNTETITNCSMKCPVNCKECVSGDGCTACMPGYFPSRNRCKRKCPQNCEKCTTNERCSSCHPEYFGRDNKYGATCEHKCPNTCNQISGMRSCDENTGHCLYGCRIGYFGAHCNTTCSELCVGDLCDQQFGTCLKGCRESGGQKTDLQCKIAGDGVFLKTTVVVPICVTVFLVNIGIIGSYLIYRRRRRHRDEHIRQTACSNSTYFDGTSHEYVDMEALGPYVGSKDYDSLQSVSVSESKDLPDYVNTQVTAF